MTLNAFLSLVTQGLFFMIAFLTLIDFLRNRDRARLDIALIFVSFAFLFLLQDLTALAGGPTRWTRLLGALVLVIHPYLTVRVVEHFRAAPARVRWVAQGAVLTFSIFLLLFDFATPLPLAFALPIVVYFVYVEGYAAFAFVRGALTAAGVARRRLALAALGTALLAGLLLLAGINLLAPISPDLLDLLGRTFAIVIGMCYYLSYATPRWLRRTWQLSELYRFLHTLGGQAAMEEADRLLDRLCAAAIRGTGAMAAVLALSDGSSPRLKLRAPQASPALPDALNDLTLRDGILGRVWREQHPMLISRLWELESEAAHLAVSMHARMLYAVPIATAQRTWGLLLVFQQGYPLFAMDDLNLLTLLAEQSALLLSYVTSLNEQQRLNDELQQRTAQMEDANKELEAFAYSVSHDLRAPLRAIDGYTRILVEDYAPALDAEGHRVCSVVREETRRMGGLIDDLLAFSRLSRAPVQTSLINMQALAHSVFLELATDEERARIDFRVAPLPAASGDAALMRQVWSNLLSNAIKFSTKCEHARVEVGGREESGETIYFVRDNGAGFDMQYADKLFGVFQRLHNEREFAGTGIGLAIVQRVIHRHGGRVWAEGAPGQGATFYFSLT
jgi:signal transduction histidine kinase